MNLVCIDRTINNPFLERFLWNRSRPYVRLICTTFETRSNHAIQFALIKPCLNDTLGGTDPSTFATVSFVHLTILNNLGYTSLKGLSPNQTSLQNRTFSPLCILKVPQVRKSALAFMRPPQRYESPGLYCTRDKGLFVRYFLLNSFARPHPH